MDFSEFIIILVLFILLVIVLSIWEEALSEIEDDWTPEPYYYW